MSRAILSPRSQSVLIGFANGLDPRTIGGYLRVSRATVFRSLRAAKAFLGDPEMSTVQAIELARARGIVPDGARLMRAGYVALSPREIALGKRL